MKALLFVFSIILSSLLFFHGCGGDDTLTYVASDPASIPGTVVPTTAVPKTDLTNCMNLSSSITTVTTDVTLLTQKNSCIEYLNSLVTAIKSLETYLDSNYDLEFITQYNYFYLNGNLFDESYDDQSSFNTAKSKLSALKTKLTNFPTQMPTYMQDQTEFVNYYTTNNAKKQTVDNMLNFMEECPYHEQYCNDNSCQCANAYMMPMF